MATELRAGFGSRDITPTVGEKIAGYILREPASTGIRDPLEVLALALQDDGATAVVLAADLVHADAEFVGDLRAEVERTSGVPGSAVAFHVIHSHASPSLGWFRNMGGASPGYRQTVLSRTVEAVSEALADLRPAQTLVTRGPAPGLSHNRRRPDGPLDDEVTCVVFLRPDRDPIGLANWACHPVCLGSDNRLVSADWVGVFRRALPHRLGVDYRVIYLNGCWGDINPVGRGPDGCEATGRGLTDVVRLMPRLQPATGAPLHVASVSVRLPLDRGVTLEAARAEVAHQEERLATMDDPLWRRECEAMLGWARDLEAAIESGQLPEDPVAEVQLIRFGDMGLVFLPGEILCELGMRIKRESPVGATIPVAGSNGIAGYLGPAHEYEAPGYELQSAPRYYGLLSFAPGSGEALVDAALALLRASA